MNVTDAALYLAETLAPLVVLRSDLEHVGWLANETAERAHDVDFLSVGGGSVFPNLTEGMRAVFCVPPRVVSGTATLVIEMSGAAD